jgi:hypothetical protein
MTRGLFKTLFSIIILYCVKINYADQWKNPKPFEIKSTNGKFVLKVKPHEKGLTQPGYCFGEFIKVGDVKPVTVWSRFLVNNYAPVEVFVPDSGKFVVTMDEWHQRGFLPIVIYGYNGELIKINSLETINILNELEKIRITVSSAYWNENSLVFFNKEEDKIIIRLKWGKMIIIDLPSGNIVSLYNDPLLIRKRVNKKEWNSLIDFANRRSRELAMQMLDYVNPKNRETAAIVAGQMKIKEAVPKLKLLLSDPSYNVYFVGLSVPQKKYYVRDAAREALTAICEKK